MGQPKAHLPGDQYITQVIVKLVLIYAHSFLLKLET